MVQVPTTSFYRNQDMSKFVIENLGIIETLKVDELHFVYRITQIDTEQEYIHKFIVRHQRGHFNLSPENKNTNINESIKCIYEMILNDDYKTGIELEGGQPFEFIHDFKQNDKYAIKMVVYGSGLRKYRLPVHNMIQQNRIARRVLLETLFNENTIVPLYWLRLEAWLPDDVIDEQIRTLEEMNFIILKEMEPNLVKYPYEGKLDFNLIRGGIFHIALAAKGIENFEKLYTGFGKTVFIIIWCELKWLAEFFKEAVVEAGYEGYIQEYEEPPKDIGSDIKERIAYCAFVIADLTGGRENCLYELGYAHALNKRTIITRKEDEVKRTTGEGEEVWKLTFDINQNKHSLWIDENDEDFKAAIKERIRQTIKSIEQDYFTI
ncbi:hypothetical protein K9N50_04780 [bacterium]|nr:hypothetical protein [bacterium]